uniref:DNA-directed DNA polymerase n=1 Tax=Panagrolaimus sp. JU765 TaxID=591449 RepID=A0AC34R9B1_9BILA
MKKKFDNYHYATSHILLQDAYYGGLTAPCKLYAETDDQHVLKHGDFVSLYPSIMSAEEFPIGHPEYMAIFEDVNWTKPEDVVLDGVEIRGVLKVVLEPPEKCLHPPVPYKTKTHLLFGLCKACCDNAQKIKNVKDCYKCEHTIEQRRFTATITSIELKMALAANFKCTHVFAAVHYDKWSNAIFHDYVKSFLKSKQEASGWPSHCTADAEKEAFLQKIKDVDGIELDPNNIGYNPGLRYLSKLSLNSLFGRFSLRCSLSRTEITRDPAVVYKMLDDKSLEVSNIDCVEMDGRETMILTYKKKDDFVEEHDTYNVLYSLWITAIGRCRLLNLFNKIEEDGHGE